MPSLTQCDIEQIMEDNSRESISSEKERGSINCPSVAVPEKIVLCVDVSQDFICKSYSLKDESSCSPLQVLKTTLTSFINNKHSFNSEHEFAVMSLEPAGVKWIHDFSSDPKLVVNAINDLELVCLTEPQDVNLTPVFVEVNKQIGNLPQVRVNAVQFPTHIVRLILVYNSSYNIPKIDTSDKTFSTLISSEYFHWDILYLHDAPSEDNNCQDVYGILLSSSLPNSYVFEASRKVVKVFNSMAKLLAHPLQRLEQPCAD